MTKSPDENIRRFEMKQIVVAGLGLLIAIGISIVVNTMHLNSVAEQATKFISRLVQVEDFREVGLTLEDTRLDGFSRIQFKSTRPGLNFTLPEAQDFKMPNGLLRYLTTERITLPTTDQLEADYSDTLTFEYNRFRLVPYAILAWIALVIVSIPQTRYMKQKLIAQFEKDLAASRAETKADIAREVRHNLRTPLSALMRIPSRLTDTVKADRDLLTSSISHIRSIVSALDDGKSQTNSLDESQELYETLNNSLRAISLIVPKDIFFLIEIQDAVVSARIPHLPHEFRSLLGNIVNNAIDAIGGEIGRIKVMAKDLGHTVEIIVEDTGCGFSNENSSRIFDKGFSSKATGSGIGLYHAKTWVEAWGGRITASSEPKETKITISLPVADRPSWYVPRLKFSKSDRLVILDDQLSAHSLWEFRLIEADILEQAEFAKSAEEVEKLIRIPNGAPERTHYLFDYDIQSKISGLDILDSLPKNSRRYLVTGHFDQASIRERCETSGVLLLPKGELPDIPIVVVG